MKRGSPEAIKLAEQLMAIALCDHDPDNDERCKRCGVFTYEADDRDIPSTVEPNRSNNSANHSS